MPVSNQCTERYVLQRVCRRCLLCCRWYNYLGTDGSSSYAKSHWFAAADGGTTRKQCHANRCDYWVTWKGYQGDGNDSACGYASPNPNAPGIMHSGTAFIAPIIYLVTPSTTNSQIFIGEVALTQIGINTGWSINRDGTASFQDLDIGGVNVPQLLHRNYTLLGRASPYTKYPTNIPSSTETRWFKYTFTTGIMGWALPYI